MKRYTVHVAAATTGDPFKYGCSIYKNITVASWLRRKREISRDHGGNIVSKWYHLGVEVDKNIIAAQHDELWINL